MAFLAPIFTKHHYVIILWPFKFRPNRKINVKMADENSFAP